MDSRRSSDNCRLSPVTTVSCHDAGDKNTKCALPGRHRGDRGMEEGGTHRRTKGGWREGGSG